MPFCTLAVAERLNNPLVTRADPAATVVASRASDNRGHLLRHGCVRLSRPQTSWHSSQPGRSQGRMGVDSGTIALKVAPERRIDRLADRSASRFLLAELDSPSSIEQLTMSCRPRSLGPRSRWTRSGRLARFIALLSKARALHRFNEGQPRSCRSAARRTPGELTDCGCG